MCMVSHLARLLCVLVLLGPALRGDDLVREHGKYSQAYQQDWSSLPNGKAQARWDLAKVKFETVAGEQVRQVFADKENVRICGRALKVRWAAAKCDKYRHTLYYFRHCKNVTVEDMAVVQMDPDFRAASTFFFESCDRVTIRRCYLAGSSTKAKIRIEGCREYFIDRVDMSGWDYGEQGIESGHGIFINNGAGWNAEKNRQRMLYAAQPRELEWGVIQNCYIHDYPKVHRQHNHDGILFHAPASGIVFNCYFENYEADSCLDISHRRNDAKYRNHVFRVERNVFDRCHRVKTNGAVGSSDCAIMWANNLYVDSMVTDYHTGWKNWHVHETYVFTHRPGYFFTMHCQPGGTLFRNCLMYAPQGVKGMYEPWARPNQDPSVIQPDHFLYLMKPPLLWLHQRGANGQTIATWPEWRAAGFDPHSKLLSPVSPFVDATARDFRLKPGAVATAAGVPDFLRPTDPRLAVPLDYLGRRRPDPPSVGALEPAEQP